MQARQPRLTYPTAEGPGKREVSNHPISVTCTVAEPLSVGYSRVPRSNEWSYVGLRRAWTATSTAKRSLLYWLKHRIVKALRGD